MRRAVLAVAVVATLGEALDAIETGWPALVFAGLFGVAALLVWRRGRLGVAVFGALMLLEVVFWPSYERDSAADWAIQVPFLVLGIAGVVLAALTLWTERRGGRPARA